MQSSKKADLFEMGGSSSTPAPESQNGGGTLSLPFGSTGASSQLPNANMMGNPQPGMDSAQPNLTSGDPTLGGNMLSSPPPTAASTTQSPQGTLGQQAPQTMQPPPAPPGNSFSQPLGSPITGSPSPLGASPLGTSPLGSSPMGGGSMQLMGGQQNMLQQILQALRGGG